MHKYHVDIDSTVVHVFNSSIEALCHVCKSLHTARHAATVVALCCRLHASDELPTQLCVTVIAATPARGVAARVNTFIRTNSLDFQYDYHYYTIIKHKH